MHVYFSNGNLGQFLLLFFGPKKVLLNCHPDGAADVGVSGLAAAARLARVRVRLSLPRQPQAGGGLGVQGVDEDPSLRRGLKRARELLCSNTRVDTYRPKVVGKGL